MRTDVDIAVVGGGIIGLFAAAEAAKLGSSVVLLEQHFPGTQEGSSAEHVRMWRTMYTEYNHSRLAYRAGDLYRNVEQTVGMQILHHSGLLNFGVETDYTPEGTLLTPIKTLEALGKDYEILTRDEIEFRYPFQNLPANYVGVYQRDNAVIDVKQAFCAALAMCIRYGVNIQSGCRAVRVENKADRVIVHTASGALSATKVVLAPGPYVNQILKASFGFELNLTIWDMCFAYYRLDGTCDNYPMWFQFDRDTNNHSNLFYGFPNVPFAREGFVRIAVDWASHTFTEVDERIYAPARVDLEIVREFVRRRMVGLDTCPIDVGRALMAHLPDNLSVLDYLPSGVDGRENVVVCAAGWAFKFAPLFGAVCANLALGHQVDEEIAEFAIDRPNVVKWV